MREAHAEVEGRKFRNSVGWGGDDLHFDFMSEVANYYRYH